MKIPSARPARAAQRRASLPLVSTLKTAAVLVTAGVLLSACAAGPAPDDDAAGTLTMAFPGPPLVGLDPALTGGADSIIYGLPAYEPLIWKAPDGSLKPALATEWGYVGEGNTDFRLVLREGVKFSDGQEVDAEAVKKYLEYFASSGGVLSGQLSGLESVEVVGDLEVLIHLSSPNPILPELLTQNWGAGWIASPQAIDEDGFLDANTAGAGPYMLDPEQTTPGDTYTYVPNPEYWNPEAITFDSVVVRVISDPNAMIAAVESGEVDWAIGTASSAAGASSAIDVVAVPGRAQQGIVLADREGTIVPALGDVRVRQAINMALDREAISDALNGGYGTGAEQLLLPGQPDYDADRNYAYDPEGAKELLAEAGYPDGFVLPLSCSQALGHCQLAEAAASQLSEVGIDVQIDAQSEVPAFNEKVLSAQAPAFIFNVGGVFEFTAFRQSVPATAGLLNPFKSDDPEMTAWLTEAAAATPDAQSELFSQIADRYAELAWSAPLVYRDALYYKGPRVVGTMPSDVNPYFNPFAPEADDAWRVTD